jgi:phosphoglycolate phosphatase
MKIASKYDGIILDIDGTIWNTTGVVAVAWNKAIDVSKLNVRKVNAQILQREFGKTMDVIADDLWPELDEKQRDILLSNCCTEEHVALKENKLDITYPSVVDTIKELSAVTNFFVVSNCQDGYIQLTLEKTGLEPYVKDFECFGRTGKGKAENIQMLVQRNQLVAPVYVGDIQGDCDACHQAGVPFIWAAYGFGDVSDYVAKLEKFSDLIEAVEIGD